MDMLTPGRAMRAKCLDCTCHQPNEIRLCPTMTCALWPYRLGRKPTAEMVEQVAAVVDAQPRKPKRVGNLAGLQAYRARTKGAAVGAG